MKNLREDIQALEARQQKRTDDVLSRADKEMDWVLTLFTLAVTAAGVLFAAMTYKLTETDKKSQQEIENVRRALGEATKLVENSRGLHEEVQTVRNECVKAHEDIKALQYGTLHLGQPPEGKTEDLMLIRINGDSMEPTISDKSLGLLTPPWINRTSGPFSRWPSTAGCI